MSEKELSQKIQQFRREYGEGQHGMVTWPLFCDFLGYSVEAVRECYQRGMEGRNAYSGRAELLETFRTACTGMTYRTSAKQQALAKAEVQTSYLKAPDTDGRGTEVRILFGDGHDHWMECPK